ncbi:hypothetical protein MBANPS3_006300 [Mucor bainieri]
MRIVCSICLEDVHENSCLAAIVRCGHIFDKACIDQALSSGHGRCPVCSAQIVGSSFTPSYFRIYPSKSENLDNQECINLKKTLIEANQKITKLQRDLSNTKSALGTSRQEQKATSSQLKETKALLENATKSAEKLKKDVDNIKRAKDECFKRNEKLKNSNQALVGNLKISENLCQTLREQLVSVETLPEDGQGVLSNAVPSSSDLQTSQVSQNDYLGLKKNYQDLIIRERLVEKKLTDITLQQEGSSYTQNLETTQKLYKQLAEALSNEKKLISTTNQLKHEKKDIVNEKKTLQERLNGALKDLKRLQEAEKLWTTNTLHLQDIINQKEKVISDLRKVNQDCTAEIKSLKEMVKSLSESLAASKNEYERLKRSNEAAKDHLERNITKLKEDVAGNESQRRILEHCVQNLQNQVTSLGYNKQTLQMENNRLLQELKAARQPWFSLK